MAYTTINDPSEYFHIQLYSGDGNTNRDITNDANAGDFQPDWLWIKNRTDSSTQNFWFNSTVGMPNHLNSDLADVEQTATNKATAFNSDGFRVQDHSQVNGSGKNYVAWQWIANGGTTTTNDASATSIGTIDSVYQANTTAGLSIVTYTGTGSAGTIAHGLGATPTVYIIKNRERSDSWRVAAEVLGYGDQLLLNDTDAEANDNNTFNNTSPTSTVFSVGTRNAVNANGEGHVAWVFAPKQGYSKFGTYKGNGSSDGVTVYTGFQPQWLMIKQRSAGGEHWRLFDSARSTTNQVDDHLFPSHNSAESAETGCDFLANGFKMRNADAHQNANNQTYFFMAFAKHPIVSSTGVPVTAF